MNSLNHRISVVFQLSKRFSSSCSDKILPLSGSLLDYCETMSTELHPVLCQLRSETMTLLTSQSHMMTHPHILRMNMLLCSVTGAG